MAFYFKKQRNKPRKENVQDAVEIQMARAHRSA